MCAIYFASDRSRRRHLHQRSKTSPSSTHESLELFIDARLYRDTTRHDTTTTLYKNNNNNDSIFQGVRALHRPCIRIPHSTFQITNIPPQQGFAYLALSTTASSFRFYSIQCTFSSIFSIYRPHSSIRQCTQPKLDRCFPLPFELTFDLSMLEDLGKGGIPYHTISYRTVPYRPMPT